MKKSFNLVEIGTYYGAIPFFTSLIHNIFLLYHVQMFVSIYKIDKYSFWIGEITFLIWNSINDPLFGWLSDNVLLNSKHNIDIVQKRLNALKIASPLLAISFLLIWFNWYIWTGLQLIISLAIYDSFLTIVDLQHSALLADLTISNENRTKLNKYSAIGSAAGSLSVFISYIFWSDIQNFQYFCVFLSIVSAFGSLYSIHKFQTYCCYPNENIDENKYNNSKFFKTSILAFSRQLWGQKNFSVFSILNLLQVFHCHFNSNFFPLFLNHLLGDAITPSTASIILGISFVAPHINNLYFLSLCRRYGTYTIIKNLLWVKVLFAAAMIIFVGPNGSYLLIGLFITSNRIFTEGTCKLLGLIISDLIDEDTVIQHRNKPVSALIFSATAFFAKPGQTLAPLIGLSLLGVLTGDDIFSKVDNSFVLNKFKIPQQSIKDYRLAAFQLLVIVPIICGIFQIFTWRNFTLHGKRLKWIKSLRIDSSFMVV